MKSFSTITKKIIGRISWECRKAIWHRKVASKKPVRFRLPGNTSILLQPDGQIPELLFMDDFEFTDLRLCSKVWRTNTTVIDIGANIGLYTIAAALNLGPQGRVYSFEPSSESRARLTRNLALNDCSNVTVIDAAVADAGISSATLIRDPGFRDGDRYLCPSASPGTLPQTRRGGDHENVRVCTLDDWSSNLPSLDISFMKIDIEGGELGVFRGAQEFLRRHRDLVIMFECSPIWCKRANCRQDDVFEVLVQAGFGLFAWSERSRRWTSDDSRVREAGNVWAARAANLLPN
jgi:FkbM family methyltransferase